MNVRAIASKNYNFIPLYFTLKNNIMVTLKPSNRRRRTETGMLKKYRFLTALHVCFIFIGILLCGSYFYGQDWKPAELVKMELKFQELGAQVTALDSYAPEKFPDFQQLEKINQLVEQLDYNKRKFDLLIARYNVLEDKMFPFLSEYYKQYPQSKKEIYSVLMEYSESGKYSILVLQEQINTLAILIEHLEKRIEFIQTTARDKALAEDTKQKSEAGKQIADISRRLVLLEQDKKNLNVKLKDEEKKYADLKAKEDKQSKKIIQKQGEIAALKEKVKASQDELLRLTNQTEARVREIRVNGLEIPRLNATKTFIYLSDTAIKTYKDQIAGIDKEIVSLKEQRREEWIDISIKAALYIAIALILGLLVIRLSHMISKRIVRRVESSQKMDVHSKQRYHTLSAVILSFIKIVTWVMAVVWVLRALNIDIGPILVAAGGVSLAIGFGAQSLVKDIVSGFFILMEKQFALGDFVDINGDSGYVEHISLRTIKIRTLDGSLHIIHNGSISSVANKTYEWSRAVVNVKVSIAEEPQKVLSALKSVCEEIANDPAWKPKLIDDPIPQGIIGLGESSADFRILAKTIPDSQWAVEREIRIRVRNAFARSGIESPTQHIHIIDRKEKE
jgi:moderate conductance mechanosensitive channel